VLNLLAETNLASDSKVHTTGLSFMCPNRGTPMGTCLLVDNAGTNAPISQVSVDRIAQKKATEQFLQEIVFLLSDVIVIVVGDLTWQDEQLIYSCTELVKRARLGGADMRLIVVHNFISAETEEELLTLWRQSVMRSYHESDDGIRRETFEPARPRDCPSHIPEDEIPAVRYYVTKDQVYHTFLAKDGSPAGLKYNHLSTALIRSFIVHQRYNKDQCFLDLLLSKIRQAAENQCVKVDECSLVVKRTNNPGDEPSTIPAVTKLTPCNALWDTFHPTEAERCAWGNAASSPVTVMLHGDVSLKRGQLAIEGNTLILVDGLSNSSPGTFQPPVDVFEDSTGVTVTLDIPGIDMSTTDPNYTFSIDAELRDSEHGRDLIIKGTRRLYRFIYQQDRSEECGWAVCDVEHYDPPDRRGPPARERMAGSFERIVNLDKVYQCPEITTMHASNGVVQVFLAKVQPRKTVPTGVIAIKRRTPAPTPEPPSEAK